MTLSHIQEAPQWSEAGNETYASLRTSDNTDEYD